MAHDANAEHRLTPLYEAPGLPGYGLPEPLSRFYGGGFGLAEPCVYANFVASLDGVTALDPGRAVSGPDISGGNVADLQLMGLLRACADAILVGAGTLRVHRRHLWTPERLCPALAPVYAELRVRIGRTGASPRLAVMTATGELDPEQAGLQAGALVLTTDGGAGRLRGRLPASCTVVALGRDRVDPARAVDAIRAEGHRTILTEGGANLLGGIVAADLLDELFLTVSPMLAGRARGDDRPGLVAGARLAPETMRWAALRSVRHWRDHLFLRYGFRRPAGASSPP